MENNIFVRKINELGQIVIPKAYLEELHIFSKEKIKIGLKGNKIILNEQDSDNMERTLDELNRIIIPRIYRETLDIKKDDEFKIILKDKQIILIKLNK